MNEMLSRTELLLGSQAMESLAAKRVIIFGVGGVGSWCAESLVRSGIGQLTMVDGDCVCVSNINRQLMATTLTVGRPKVEVLRERLLAISPGTNITARHELFTEATAHDFALSDYDYVIDAIDSLRDKALLILQACQSNAVLFSSMGAALKLDPCRIRIAEFWKVQGDPLARCLRKWFKRQEQFPQRKFQCVYSDEQPANRGVVSCSPLAESTEEPGQRRPNGTVAHVTAVFGFMLASLVVRHAIQTQHNKNTV